LFLTTFESGESRYTQASSSGGGLAYEDDLTDLKSCGETRDTAITLSCRAYVLRTSDLLLFPITSLSLSIYLYVVHIGANSFARTFPNHNNIYVYKCVTMAWKSVQLHTSVNTYIGTYDIVCIPCSAYNISYYYSIIHLYTYIYIFKIRRILYLQVVVSWTSVRFVLRVYSHIGPRRCLIVRAHCSRPHMHSIACVRVRVPTTRTQTLASSWIIITKKKEIKKKKQHSGREMNGKK